MINHYNLKSTILYYKNLYDKFGKSPKSLGWHKGNQFLRYKQLINNWDLNNSSILDVGCGFGDFANFLKLCKIKNFKYTGIDLMSDFIDISKKKLNNKNIVLYKDEFLTKKFKKKYDYVIASGTFNLKIKKINKYIYLFNMIKKMFLLSKKSISFDFLSDKVDYSHNHNFNYSPEKVLTLAYKLSKNIELKNSLFPFEPCIIINKNDNFNKRNSIYSLKKI